MSSTEGTFEHDSQLRQTLPMHRVMCPLPRYRETRSALLALPSYMATPQFESRPEAVPRVPITILESTETKPAAPAIAGSEANAISQ